MKKTTIFDLFEEQNKQQKTKAPERVPEEVTREEVEVEEIETTTSAEPDPEPQANETKEEEEKGNEL